MAIEAEEKANRKSYQEEKKALQVASYLPT
jgi:hypothetical protein